MEIMAFIGCSCFVRHGLQKHLKSNVFGRLVRENISVSMNLATTIIENVDKTNSLHNFHDFSNYGLRGFGDFKRPKFMEVIGYTNIFHEFGSENHETRL